MGIKKRFLLLLSVIVVLASFLTACSSSQSTSTSGGDDKIVIGAAMPLFDDKFMTYLQDSMQKVAKEKNVELKMVDAKNDSAKQLSQVETFITQGVDVILIAAVDPTSIQPAIDSAKEANIPIVLVNRMPSEKLIQQVYAYVGSESIQSGTMQMEEVAKILGGKGNVAIIHGQPGDEAEIYRTKGNKDIIAKNPDMKVIREGTAGWQRAEGMKLMENWIQSGDKFNAVVANNDEMAIGAIQALEAAGKLNEVLVAGIDGTPDALEYVKSGKLKVSAFQNPMEQGSKAIEACIQATKGEKIADKHVWVPFEVITKDNVDTYVEKWKKGSSN